MRGVAAIVQARVSSTRLPGKVLMDLGGEPVLAVLLGRLAHCTTLESVMLATSTEASDDPIAALGAHRGIAVTRGPLDDVLQRYAMAAKDAGCEGIVRITGDCPLIEPEVVDTVVEYWLRSGADYAANCLPPRTFPQGLDTEVFSRSALERAAREATEAADREHVTPFLRRRTDLFRHARVELDPPAADIRVELNTKDDLTAIRALVARVSTHADLGDILRDRRDARVTFA